MSLTTAEFLEKIAGLGNIIRLSTVAKATGFRTANNPIFKQLLEQLQKDRTLEIVRSGWKSEWRSGCNHNKVVLLKVSVWKLHSEEESKVVSHYGFLCGAVDKKEPMPIQSFSHRRRCCKCPEFKPSGSFGSCLKYGWEIVTELAERQTLCYYGDEETIVIPSSLTSPIKIIAS